jgi:hypothetical protein
MSVEPVDYNENIAKKDNATFYVKTLEIDRVSH